jgi:hypothetical protein
LPICPEVMLPLATKSLEESESHSTRGARVSQSTSEGEICLQTIATHSRVTLRLSLGFEFLNHQSEREKRWHGHQSHLSPKYVRTALAMVFERREHDKIKTGI